MENGLSQLTYNREEQDFIERIHAVFPKVELDPEVAIGALATYKNGTYFHMEGMCCLEPWDVEFFFRGIFIHDEYSEIWKRMPNVFYPSRFQPLPWWEIRFEDVMKHRGVLESRLWWSPYGMVYYIPFLMLAAIHDMRLDRLGLTWEEQESCYNDSDIQSYLTPPESLAGKDCWAEAAKLDVGYKDPLHKDGLYSMDDGLQFLIFISFINEDQKRVISEFARYYTRIFIETHCCYGEFQDEVEAIERLKTCWDAA